MKRINSIFFAAAAAALSLVSCSQENLAPTEKPQGELVTVHFGAESGIASTKATLTPDEDEATFSSAWTDGDVLSVDYENSNGQKDIVDATWQSSSASFDANLPSYTGAWEYYAVYPSPDATEGTVDFGSARTQKGNEYNSQYDLMYGSADAYEAPAGKDDSGKDIIFKMNRQTAIAYFHLTSGLDEEVVSATLSVEGEVAAIASSLVMPIDYKEGFDLSKEDLKSITITYEDGTAPSAKDFKLWFNVLQTFYDKMTLTVETTGHTMSISRTSKEDTYEAGKLYKVVKTIPTDKWVEKTAPVAKVWHETVLSDIAADNEVVITMAKDGNVYALTSANGTSSAPTAVLVTVKDGELTAEPDDALIWNISNDKGNLTIYPNGQTNKWLYSTSDNNGIRIGNNETAVKNKLFVIDSDYDYLKNVTTSRYLGIYQSNDWRSYTTMHTNISGQTLRFYVKGNAKTVLSTPANLKVDAQTKTISWDVVANAGSYIVTIGDKTFDASTNSYAASAVEDEYYDVTVVAVPSDKDNFKNSDAAELKDAKFGTPKLNAPVLTEGAIDETSIRVNMTVDSRAANGCNCEIYDGEKLLQTKTIKVSYVTFTGLESKHSYTIKVNAIAVDGDKAYAASETSTIELATKSAQQVCDVTAAGTYTIKNLKVYAVPNANNVIAGDETGFILVYKSSHGLKVGNTFDVAGSVVEYNGIWEFNQPSITNKANGETPVYSGAVDADESYLTSYVSSSKVEYIHAKGEQSSRFIKVGSQTLYLSADNATTDGKNVEVYGFVYGYSEKNANMSFVATSIAEDHSVPTLAVDKTSKTWASDGVEPFVVKVTVNADGGDWNVTPTSLDWATVIADKAAGTITVTPNGKNESDKANEATLTVTHGEATSLAETITLKQLQAGASVLKTVTIDFTAQNYSNGKEVSSLTVSPITVSFNKGTNSNAPKYYNSGTAIRCYGGNYFTITGAEINKVEVSFGSSDGSNEIKTDSGAFEDGAWKGTSSSVKFTINGSSGNRRIQKLIVTYAE